MPEVWPSALTHDRDAGKDRSALSIGHTLPPRRALYQAQLPRTLLFSLPLAPARIARPACSRTRTRSRGDTNSDSDVDSDDSSVLLTPSTPPSSTTAGMLSTSPPKSILRRPGTPYPPQPPHLALKTPAALPSLPSRAPLLLPVSLDTISCTCYRRPLRNSNSSSHTEPHTESPAHRAQQLANTIHAVLTAYARLRPLCQSPVILASLKRYHKRAQGLLATNGPASVDSCRRLSVISSRSGSSLGCADHAHRADRPVIAQAKRTPYDGVAQDAGFGAQDIVDLELRLAQAIDTLEQDWWNSDVVANWFGPQPHTVLPARRCDKRQSSGSQRRIRSGRPDDLAERAGLRGTGLDRQAAVEAHEAGCPVYLRGVPDERDAYRMLVDSSLNALSTPGEPTERRERSRASTRQPHAVVTSAGADQSPQSHSIQQLYTSSSSSAALPQAQVHFASNGERAHFQLSPGYSRGFKAKRQGLETIMMNERATDLIRMSSFVGLWDE